MGSYNNPISATFPSVFSFNMLYLLSLLFAATVFASEESSVDGSMLATCAIYQAAYPQGHTEADLSTPILTQLNLPEDVLASAQEMMGTSEVTTAQYYSFYQLQMEFCTTNAALLETVIADLRGEGEMSEETAEYLDIALFELAAHLYDTAEAGRRSLLIIEGIFLTVVGGLIVYSIVHNVSNDCRRRRRRALSTAGARLLKGKFNPSVAARRALSATDDIVIPTMDIVSACSHNIPSFVCSMSALYLTQVLSSDICGSGSLSSCDFNSQLALDYLSGN